MATLSTSSATTGYVPSTSLYVGAVASGTLLTTAGAADPPTANVRGHEGYRTETFHFTDVNNGDTWTSNIPNIRQVFWCGDDDTDDWVCPRLTTQATGVVRFGTDNAASANAGWLLVLRGM
jgi:hypothetical protein